MYEKFYRTGQKLIGSILYTNKNFKINLATLIEKSKFSAIHDIGGSDGDLLNYINLGKKKYFCYDIDKHNILKGKKKFKNKDNIKFLNKSINSIKIKNNKKNLILLLGVIHHLDDDSVKEFISKLSKNVSIIAIDGFYHEDQNFFSKILLKLDKGNYVRNFLDYKTILKNFRFKKRVNYYLKYYSHLISYKNVNKKLIKIL